MRRLQYRLDRSGLSLLFESLLRRNYEVLAPQLRDNALRWLPLSSVDALPAGWTTGLDPASYRLARRTGDALFGFWTGPDSLKQFLHPARASISKTVQNGDGLRVLYDPPKPVKRAFLGVRSCDLAAVAILDRVLLQDRFVDDIYKANREASFFIAVNCTESAPTCFCASMNTGPRAVSGFDIALTEIVDGDTHEFLAEAGTPAGKEVLEETGAPRSTKQCAEYAGASQQRKVNAAAARAVIDRTFDSPRWDEVASRCLACGNCTSVCPTCFCINIEDQSSLDLESAERVRVWDSCFTQAFSYIHGGSIRLSTRSRYRQWLSHKLARWQDQFGSPGCTGCGRCIVWCPAAIDITEEFGALEAAASAPFAGVGNHGK